MASSLRTYRVPVLLLLMTGVFLVGGGLFINALSHPATIAFPADGHLKLDHVAGNNVYSAWHRLPAKAALNVTRVADKTDVKVHTETYGDESAGMNFIGRFETLKEGAYDVAIAGLASGDDAVLVEENGFKWMIPSFVCAMLAFGCFLSAGMSWYAIRHREAA